MLHRSLYSIACYEFSLPLSDSFQTQRTIRTLACKVWFSIGCLGNPHSVSSFVEMDSSSSSSGGDVPWVQKDFPCFYRGGHNNSIVLTVGWMFMRTELFCEAHHAGGIRNLFGRQSTTEPVNTATSVSLLRLRIHLHGTFACRLHICSSAGYHYECALGKPLHQWHDFSACCVWSGQHRPDDHVSLCAYFHDGTRLHPLSWIFVLRSVAHQPDPVRL